MSGPTAAGANEHASHGVGGALVRYHGILIERRMQRLLYRTALYGSSSALGLALRLRMCASPDYDRLSATGVIRLAYFFAAIISYRILDL